MTYCKSYSEYWKLAKEKRAARREIISNLSQYSLHLDPDDHFLHIMGQAQWIAYYSAAALLGFGLSRYFKSTPLCLSLPPPQSTSISRLIAVLPLLNVVVKTDPRDGYVDRYWCVKYARWWTQGK